MKNPIHLAACLDTLNPTVVLTDLAYYQHGCDGDRLLVCVRPSVFTVLTDAAQGLRAKDQHSSVQIGAGHSFTGTLMAPLLNC